MTARKTSQLCESSSHYTCSGTNCNPIQQNTAPINGTACLKRSMSFKRSNDRRAAIVRVALSLAIAILLVLTAVFLMGCGRGAGEFPNIPEVMDECRLWSEEEFASKMNLSDDEFGGRGLASDLSSAMNGDSVCMYFTENGGGGVRIWIGSSSIEDEIPLDSLSEILGYERFDYGFDDAIELLGKFGITKNSIKVYDDVYSKGLEVAEAVPTPSYTVGSLYNICGEAQTAEGDPLFFCLEADAGAILMQTYQANSWEWEARPFDAVQVNFSRVSPFSLTGNERYSSHSDKPISTQGAFGSFL